MTNDQYKESVAILNKMAYAYYVLDDPIASDEEYDSIYHQIKTYENQNPSSILPYSPTQRVGDIPLSSFSKNTHLQRMWSLDDIFNSEELQEWCDKIYKAYPDAIFTCSPKFDGASLNLLYESGILKSATTRGDGIMGELVTQNAKTIQSIPLQIPILEPIEIRGEIVITKEDFEKLNQERLETNQPLFANPRNAAAGSMRQLDSTITAKRRLNFIPWGFGAHSLHYQSFFESMRDILKLGFSPIPFIRLCKNMQEIQDYYTEIMAMRNSYPMMLDGMVIMLDSFAMQNKLGFTIKSPRFSCAYKFPAVEKITRILSVTQQIGRTGIITPVAELEPVEIEGAEIKRATLHNYKEIQRKDIRIHDYVIIIRSGDVIPKIIKSLPARRDGSQKEIIPPTHCPECGSELLVEDIFIKCQKMDCKARIKEGIIHFVSKKALNIEGLGEKIIDQLLQNNLISGILDLYTLDFNELLKLEGWKEKKARNLIEAIAATKNIELWRLINALGIEHIGEGASKKLALSFGVDCFNQNKEELIQLDGFGEEMVESFLEFCRVNQKFIHMLLKILTPKTTKTTISNSPLFGKSIVITGTLSKGREEIKEFLESYGAKISSSVSAKTDFLLHGKDAGSKLEKAKQLGVKLLSEEDLIKILE